MMSSPSPHTWADSRARSWIVSESDRSSPIELMALALTSTFAAAVGLYLIYQEYLAYPSNCQTSGSISCSNSGPWYLQLGSVHGLALVVLGILLAGAFVIRARRRAGPVDDF